jgi:hypothetical protein
MEMQPSKPSVEPLISRRALRSSPESFGMIVLEVDPTRGT